MTHTNFPKLKILDEMSGMMAFVSLIPIKILEMIANADNKSVMRDIECHCPEIAIFSR